MTATAVRPALELRQLRVLLIEDNSSDAELATAELQHAGFEVLRDLVDSRSEVEKCLEQNTYDVVLADYNLPHFSGMEVVEIVRKQGKTVPVILVTGALNSVTAVECVKQGATDYVLKDHLPRLTLCVRRALDEQKALQEKARAEAELAQKVEELARSNRDLEQFAYVASHDLQEPLRMVAAYTQLLAQRYSEKLDADANKYIAYAVEGALRMQTLVQDLLTLSRVGRNGIIPKAVDCNAVVREVQQNLAVVIQETGAVIKHGALPSVRSDHLHMVQLFQNLLGNALKFRSHRPPVISVSAQLRGPQWEFAVADNGLGIAAQHREAIFVVFQRLHTRAEYPGNGVGLAICKKIVEQHGGRIWAEPAPGEGAALRFTLPAVAADEENGHAGNSAC